MMEIKYFGFALWLVVMGASASDCQIGSNPASSGPMADASITFSSSISVQRDAAVGTVIATSSSATPNITRTGCRTPWVMHYTNGIFSGQSSITGVYNTNVAGVGIRYKNIPSNWLPYDQNINANNWLSSLTPGVSTTPYELIKIGDITGGTLNIGTLMNVSMIDSDGGVEYPLLKFVLTSSTTIVDSGCTVLTPNINVPLGDVNKSLFTRIGQTPKSQTFTISLQCNIGARLNYTLEGTKSTETSVTSVLALTNYGSPDVATGVGVQILDSGTPLILGQPKFIKQSSGTQENLSLTARYYQTKSTVTTGLANATATLNLTYQ